MGGKGTKGKRAAEGITPETDEVAARIRRATVNRAYRQEQAAANAARAGGRRARRRFTPTNPRLAGELAAGA